MAGYWASPEEVKDDSEIAGLMNSTPKIVFSKTLAKADWNNTRLVKDNIGDEISKLKKQSGKDLAIFGSANLMSDLMRVNLVDEHRVMVNPGAPSVVQQCLKAGLMDEIHIDLIPALLFNGVRLFDHLDIQPMNLEITEVDATGEVVK
jgi:dihydrofolate reductase